MNAFDLLGEPLMEIAFLLMGLYIGFVVLNHMATTIRNVIKPDVEVVEKPIIDSTGKQVGTIYEPVKKEPEPITIHKEKWVEPETVEDEWWDF